MLTTVAFQNWIRVVNQIIIAVNHSDYVCFEDKSYAVDIYVHNESLLNK